MIYCLNRIDSKDAVEQFLNKAKEILNDKNFDIKNNFSLKQVRERTGDDRNRTTMIELGFNVKDVIEEIKKLSVKDYKETVIDNMPGKKNPFYCFVKFIDIDQVYIKFKLSEVKGKQIFCVSFHFVDYPVADHEFPYKY